VTDSGNAGGERFRAYVAEKKDAADGTTVERGLRELGPGDLPDGDVTVRVGYSSVNYKDALATIPKGQVARIPLLIPGIDLAGEVVASDSPDVAVGDQVVVHGYGLGTSHHGGFAELARVPAGWVVPLPGGLTTRQAMALGTAGYTAALSVQLLEERGLTPGDGPVVVTGASGGVGSMAVSMLAGRGYDVTASTGRTAEAEWLKGLGAAEVIDREELAAATRPLEKQRWAGAVDAVGGSTLAHVLAELRIGAGVAACGNTAGMKLETTVAPFILRGVALLGSDSANTPIGARREVWARMAGDLRPGLLEDSGSVTEVGLDDLEPVLDRILQGQVRGRTVVRLAG
jgi:acrylyl-CoA reductase (NADPH)